MTADSLSPEILQTIWTAHGLGLVEHLEQPAQGNINRCWIVNKTHVIRFDVLDWGGANRYAGERWAVDLLADDDVPVPRMIVLDASGRLTPYHYLIMTRVPGRTVSDSLRDLSAAAQGQIAFSAGAYLATLHGHTFAQFGLLHEIAAGKPQPDWAAFVRGFYQDYGQQAQALGVLPENTWERIQAVMDRMQPLFAALSQGCMVHGDYHYANLLQQDGVLTGVVDFDWVMSGDPMWDFRVDEQLEAAAAGSQKAFYAGYTSRRALPEAHAERVAFYRIGLYLDYLATFAPADATETTRTLPRLLHQLGWLEATL